MVSTLLKTVQVPQLLFIDKFVDILVVVVQRQVAMGLLVLKTVQVPQLQFIDKFVDILFLLCNDSVPWSCLCCDQWRFHRCISWQVC